MESSRRKRASNPLPHNAKAESLTIGSLFVDPSQLAAVSRILAPRDFVDPLWGHVYASMQRLRAEAKPLDLTLIVEQVKKRLGDEVDLAAIGEAAALVPAGVQASHYAEIVRECSFRRQLIMSAEGLAEQARNGHSVEELSACLRANADDFERLVDSQSGRAALPLHSATELSNMQFQDQMIVRGILCRDQPAIIGGLQKTLKTSIALDLAVSLATGTLFLQRFEVDRALRVVFMSGEAGLPTLQESIRRICRAKDLSPETPNLYVSPVVPSLENPAHIEWLKRTLDGEGFEVLFVDPAYLSMSGADAGNLFIQGERFRKIHDLCVQCGTTFVLVHHLKRGGVREYSEAPELADLAWSGFAEFAGQWLLIGRRAKYEPGSGHHEFWLNVGSRVGFGGLWGLDIYEGSFMPGVDRLWNVDVRPADEVRDQVRDARNRAAEDQRRESLDKLEQKILAHVTEEPSTKNRTRDAVKGDTRRFAETWDRMVDDGTIRAVGKTKGRGPKTDLFGPPEDDEE